jgi:hypothetical protein
VSERIAILQSAIETIHKFLKIPSVDSAQTAVKFAIRVEAGEK